MDLAEVVRQHLEAWRAAGIEWVPLPPAAAPALKASAAAPRRATPLQTPPPAAPPLAVPSPALFGPVAADGPPLPTTEKRRLLQALDEQQVRGCTRCAALARCRTQTVFGVGNVDCELCFVGEAPGADEDASGEPFVGAAGQLLNKIIEACKMTRGEVYICNVLKCRPPGNRTPLPDEVANCRPFLEEQLRLLRPKFICCLGAVAAQALLETTQSIGRLRGKFHRYGESQVLCTYHPAYLLRNPAAKRDVWEDMKVLMQAMGRPVA
jgi:DNA polymerase